MSLGRNVVTMVVIALTPKVLSGLEAAKEGQKKFWLSKLNRGDS